MRFAGLALALFLSLSGYAEGAIPAPTVLYTFEAPNFSSGDVVPLIDRPPNVGDPAFLASFTATSGGGDFYIGENPNLPSGWSLYDVNLGSPSTLTISLNSAVSAVHLDFALIGPGYLSFTSASGNTSAQTDPFSQAGQLSFSSAEPFTEFTLAGFSEVENQIVFGIDNVEMTLASIPEPTTFTLLGLGSLALGMGRRRHPKA